MKPVRAWQRRTAALIRAGWRKPRHGDGCTYSPDGWVVGAGANARYVSIVGCCEAHDEDYRLGRPRRPSDLRLRRCIECRLRHAGSKAAYLLARTYFTVVRGVGWAFFNARSDG